MFGYDPTTDIVMLKEPGTHGGVVNLRLYKAAQLQVGVSVRFFQRCGRCGHLESSLVFMWHAAGAGALIPFKKHQHVECPLHQSVASLSATLPPPTAVGRVCWGVCNFVPTPCVSCLMPVCLS